MKRFCVNCGSEVNGNFCPKCGTKVDNFNVDNSQVDVNNPQVFTNSSTVNNAQVFTSSSAISKKNYNTYRTIVGIIMIIIGVCLLLFSFSDDQTRAYEIAGYSIMMSFTLPGVCSLFGGVLSILSKKNNRFLLYSGICYFGASIINMFGISDIFLLFIIGCLFGILNIVFFNKTR